MRNIWRVHQFMYMLSPSLHKILIKHIDYYGNNDLTSSVAIGILQTLHSRVQFYLETVKIFSSAPKLLNLGEVVQVVPMQKPVIVVM